MVLVAGASTAGKTRALAASLVRTLPGRMLVNPPQDADLRPLPAWLKDRAEQPPQGWVIWLDDLDRHLAASGLTPSLVAELGRAGAVVAATIRANQLRALRPSATDDHGPASKGVGYEVLKTLPVVVDRRWSSHERERARASKDERLVRAADDERFGVAEHMAAGPRLQQDRFEGADGGHPRGYAFVAVAVGIAQTGLSSPLTRDQIHAVHTAYLPGAPHLPEDADRAWEWATRRRSGRAGMLVPADSEGLRWRAFDYLTSPDSLPEAIWRIALQEAGEQDRYTIGITAFRARRNDIARTAWSPLVERGHRQAMSSLGFLMKNADQVDKAEYWYRRAAEQGDLDAMFKLAVRLEDAKRFDGAEYWYRKAAERDDPDAMFNLGVMLYEAGDEGQAEDWWQKAAKRGQPDAMFNRGYRLYEAGRNDEAEEWWQKAAKRGQPDAMFNLAKLLEAAGHPGQADFWWTRFRNRK
ncbi:tetratricopeptide repeat protein [Nocardiopsis sp. MG754419]|uniref:tetratricopeptide repeat protein n=1 Tax=Nocardiopsis sp. MG754419 TaxID=2259865 RepID=UPI001BAA4BA3|nr:tetratricopeptide repeat protein [Nocardiopsis sp. MG754419]